MREDSDSRTRSRMAESGCQPMRYCDITEANGTGGTHTGGGAIPPLMRVGGLGWYTLHATERVPVASGMCIHSLSPYRERAVRPAGCAARSRMRGNKRMDGTRDHMSARVCSPIAKRATRLVTGRHTPHVPPTSLSLLVPSHPGSSVGVKSGITTPVLLRGRE